MTAQDIKDLISQDAWMMEVLRIVREQNLLDWWIGAGFVRNKVWDVLHDYTIRTPLNDIDVIYFDTQHVDEQFEKDVEKKLRESYLPLGLSRIKYEWLL